MTETSTASQILATLNSNEGSNIWQEVIYDLLTGEEWDSADDSGADTFDHDGVTFRYEPSLGEWVTA